MKYMTSILTITVRTRRPNAPEETTAVVVSTGAVSPGGFSIAADIFIPDGPVNDRVRAVYSHTIFFLNITQQHASTMLVGPDDLKHDRLTNWSSLLERRVT